FTLDTRDPESLLLAYDVDTSALEVVEWGARADVPLLASDGFAIRVATASNDTMTGPGTRSWVSYDEVPEHFPAALVASEDNRFFSHQGFDAAAIEKSLVANLSAGRIVRGGSTISQQ